MAHRYFQTVAGAVDTSADDATELKWELDEIVFVVLFHFLVDQEWSPVGTIEDLAFVVVFLYFGSVVGPLIVHWMMYDIYLYLCEVAIVSQLSTWDV